MAGPAEAGPGERTLLRAARPYMRPCAVLLALRLLVSSSRAALALLCGAREAVADLRICVPCEPTCPSGGCGEGGQRREAARGARRQAEEAPLVAQEGDGTL